MALPKQYLTARFAKIEDYFNTTFGGQAPEKFTQSFLEQLGFTSTNDRLFIGILKSLNFLDESGTPTDRYYQALDQTKRQKLVADGIREAYSDLFNLNREAYNMTTDEITGKFKTLTLGKIGDSAINYMVRTFEELCKYADWSENITHQNTANNVEEALPEKEIQQNDKEVLKNTVGVKLNYDIHIHLPATRDIGVYDALFTSLKKHLID